MSAPQQQMIVVPNGTIRLRDDRKKTSWTIEIKSFLLSKYPVTQDLYLAVTGQNPSSFQAPRNPVENVSWFNAVEFCNQISQQAGLRPCYSINDVGADFDETANGFRLPSEAEWEFACRAGNSAATYGELEQIAWHQMNSGGSTHEVGMKRPNSWGLYDMLGNVWEWCGDLYDEQVYSSYRVFRGGGWSDPARGCLASNRRRSHPSFKIDDIGFRLAQSIINYGEQPK